MTTKKMSIAEYVAYRKKNKNSITSQAIAKSIREGRLIPGVEGVEMFGRTYVLYVDLNSLDNFLVSIKKPFKLHKNKK